MANYQTLCYTTFLQRDSLKPMPSAQMSRSLYEIIAPNATTFHGDSAQRYLVQMYMLGKLRFPSLLVLQCLQVT